MITPSYTNEIVKLLWIAFFPHHRDRCTQHSPFTAPAAFMARNSITSPPFLLQHHHQESQRESNETRGSFFFYFDAQKSAKGKTIGMMYDP